MEIENENTFRASLSAAFNLFLGAGFSANARSSVGRLPVGAALADELRSAFGIDAGGDLGLSQLSTILARTRSDELDAFLRRRYEVSSFDDRYGAIERLPVESIFTTNIDNLIPRIYEGSSTRYLNDIFQHGAALSTRSAVELIQLHGRVDDPSRPLTFSTLDIAAARSSDPDQWNLFRQRLQSRPTLFWGYAMADSGTLEAVRSAGTGQPTEGDAWIQVRPGGSSASTSEYYRALGFQVILADTDELLDYLVEYVSKSVDSAAPAGPDLENVPPQGSTVARPVEEYFLGHTPTWSDIYSKSVAETSYLRKLREKIAARQNVILTGIPGCGKTTLMMQLAAFVHFPGPKLIFDGLQASRASLIARRVGSKTALIFMDNVSSDIEAFEILSALDNVVVIGADRDYNLGSVSNRLRSLDVDIVPVSNLQDYDLQYLWNAIPVRIRTRTRRVPEMSNGRGVSAFEFILANVKSTPLGDKLIDSIHEMYDEQDLHWHLLLAACYMSYSRSQLSMDVLVAYMRGLVNDYSQIYVLVDQLGELLDDVDLGGQDAFSARSMIVAEHVLDNVRPSILRDFLRRFHSEVSPLRVSTFEAFRRRAYRWHIFVRAFPNVVDGQDIYDEIISKDGSREILQQKALYLAEKRRYEEAFFELDRARSSQRRVSWSIENSYYKVLFKANVERAASDLESQVQCRNALDGLERCYSKDRRKGMHALVYAGCAKEYAVLVDDQLEAIGRLTRAEEMLEACIAEEPWLFRPPILLREVQRARRGLPVG